MAGQPKRRARESAGELAAGTRRPGDPTPVHDAAERKARGYQWEALQSGHFLSLRHGAYSERLMSGLAQELVGWLVDAYRDLANPRYRSGVAAWARAETRVALLDLWLDAKGIVDTDHEGEPRERILRELRAEERRAAEERRNLGLDPASHAKLERARAEAVSRVSLEELRARGAANIRARGLRVLGDDDPEPAA